MKPFAYKQIFHLSHKSQYSVAVQRYVSVAPSLLLLTMNHLYSGITPWGAVMQIRQSLQCSTTAFLNSCFQALLCLNTRYFLPVCLFLVDYHMCLIKIELFLTHGMAQQSSKTWSGITIGKLTLLQPPPPHYHMCLIKIELFHTYYHDPGQGRAQSYNLQRYDI